MIRPSSCMWGALIALLATTSAHAIGTAAGTSIQNTAQVSYTVGATTLSTTSNTTTIAVAEILDVAVTLNNATVSVTPGATQQELVFTVTNTGNGTESFALAGLSTLSGDDFDPTPAAPNFIYFDTDGSGDFSGADTPYVANTNDPVLAADAQVRIIVVNDIPNSVANGQRGRSQLAASSRTRTGTAGQSFPGEGDGGLEAIIGSSGAAANAFGEYLVEALQISAVKSQAVADQFSGQRPIPGARINYQIVVTAVGSGTATAVTFTDAIPANTTYVAGSLALNSVALSDTGGNDAGEYATTPTPRVLVNLGDLTAASGAQTITFAVTIN